MLISADISIGCLPYAWQTLCRKNLDAALIFAELDEISPAHLSRLFGMKIVGLFLCLVVLVCAAAGEEPTKVQPSPVDVKYLADKTATAASDGMHMAKLRDVPVQQSLALTTHKDVKNSLKLAGEAFQKNHILLARRQLLNALRSLQQSPVIAGISYFRKAQG